MSEKKKKGDVKKSGTKNPDTGLERAQKMSQNRQKRYILKKDDLKPDSSREKGQKRSFLVKMPNLRELESTSAWR